jgi:iron complex outermembrane receptor protein
MRSGRLAALFAACVSLVLAESALAVDLKQEALFDIPPQRLASALLAFSHQAGVQVVVGLEVRDQMTSGVKGRQTLGEALSRLLANSTFQYTVVGESSISVGEPGHTRTLALGERFRLAQADQTTSTASSPVEEIVVTAQKRLERLQDVPVAVSALSAQSLVESNHVRIQDFAASVPGLTVSPSPSAGGQQMLAIRGISTGFNTNPTVGITVDDVPYGSSTNLAGNVVPDIDPSDLARVEVLRGPQGALYGASSMGGLLKFVTVDPSPDKVSGRAAVGTIGVHNGAALGYNARAGVNIPVTSTLAIRASGFMREDPGYIDNPVLGIEGVNEAHVGGGRLAALWEPSQLFSVRLSALYQRFKGDGTNDVGIQPGLADLQQNYVRGIGVYDRKIQAYSATITASPGPVELISLTGYNVNDFADSFDFSYAFGSQAQSRFGVAGAAVFTASTTRKFTEELRATIPITQRIEWLVGGFYTHEDVPFTQNVIAMDPAAGARAGSLLLIDTPQTYAEYAGFTDLTFTITDRFDIQVGGRQSHIERTALDVPDAAANAFTYLLTPRFTISPDLMVYARAASGYRAGGQNTNPDPTAPRTFDPDKTQNYELGLKGSAFNRSLTFDLSLYHIDWKGLQLNLLSPNNNRTYTTNVSRARSRGVELSVESRPMRGLELAAWATWNDAVLTEDTGSSVAYGLAGDRLPYGTRKSGHASADYEFPIAGNLLGRLGGTVTYTGDRIGTFVATPLRQRYPSYTTVDLRAGLIYEAWEAHLYGNNIADERGVLGGGVGTFPPFAFSYIQPRTIGLSVSRTF